MSELTDLVANNYELEMYEDDELLKIFNKKVEEFYNKVRDEFQEYKKNHNPSYLRSFKCKYPYLSGRKITKRTDITKFKSSVYNLLNHSFFKDFNSQVKIIIAYCIKKIRGVFKHAQAYKTGFINLQILTTISEKKTISVCITKNSLEANQQWLERLIKKLKEKYPTEDLSDLIMIISSKKKDLNKNATHCINFAAASQYFHRNNKFKIIFICSNKTRVSDISSFTSLFHFSLTTKLKRNLRIIHDEAHNKKEGIPPYRNIVENIILSTNVLSYTPVSASPKSLYDDENPLWITRNMEKNACDYTKFDNTLSTNENYSSVNDSEKISFEDLKKTEDWKDYNIRKFPKEMFEKVYINEKYSDKDIEEKRKLAWFPMCIQLKDEIEEVNNGLNLLEIMGKKEIYKPNEFNLHIISTRCRKIVTHYLATEAIKKKYKPWVLAIYGNEGDKYHLFTFRKNEVKEKNVSKYMGEGEFNEKLNNLFEVIKEKEENMKFPFIIIGNYHPTGESISFVNYKYGTIKSNARLLSTNAEEDYQQACRSNYMTAKFKEHNREWHKSKKYIIGPKQYIDNSIEYETENDIRIENLEKRDPVINSQNHIKISEILMKESSKKSNGRKAIPIKITIDRSEPLIKEFLEICNKHIRSDADKNRVLEIFKSLKDDDESDFEMKDETNKFNFETFRLKDFRCYKKKESGPKKGVWKFESYKHHHKLQTPFMNNEGNHKKGECEILVPYDKYILRGETKKIVEQSPKNIIYMGYKY